MVATKRRRWTHEETVAALALYCQIPFGRMHAKNRDVQDLASFLERTPASIALKLVNFASLDPEHQRRGVKGMGNVSALDRQVWEQYYGNWESLAQTRTTSSEADDIDSPATETEAIMTLRVRRGQSFFRRSVLAAHDNRCCITTISSPSLLRASHIVPWSHEATYRVDPRNGLAMNALHDAAFDRGLMTLDNDLRVVLSKHLGREMPANVYKQFFETYAGKTIVIPARFAPCREYIEYHREHIFRN